MVSTYTSNLRLEKQGDGDNNNTWGTKENASKELIEDSIAGMDTIAVSGGGTSLTANDGATDQARMAILKFTGTLTENHTITIPAASKIYVIWNATTPTASETFTVKTSGGTGIVLGSGTKNIIFCDGTDTFAISPDSLNSILDANSQVIRQAELRDFSETVNSIGNISGTLGAGAIDFTDAPVQTAILTGNVTIANNSIANWPATGKAGRLELILTQDATGSRTLTLGSAFNASNGAIALSTAANARDRLLFMTEDGGTTIDVTGSNNFS